MKHVLPPIVAAALLASAPVAAGPPDSCAGGPRPLAVPQAASTSGPGSAQESGKGCKAVIVKANLLEAAQNFLSDKELEQALRRQLNGRLIDAKLNAARVEYTVLWEEQQAGKRKLRKLIVDAKTGKVKREIRGSS